MVGEIKGYLAVMADSEKKQLPLAAGVKQQVVPADQFKQKSPWPQTLAKVVCPYPGFPASRRMAKKIGTHVGKDFEGGQDLVE